MGILFEMNIREPKTLERSATSKRVAKKKRLRHRVSFFLFLIVATLIYVSYSAYSRTLPVVAAQQVLHSIPAQSVSLSWPSKGEAAIGIQGQGVIATSGTQYETPTASVAKMMDTLAILKKYPLSLGEQGPLITVTQQDANLYNSYVAEDGSVVPVNVGEQLTEYQALEAMLIPSANNVADMMAIWAYGSMSSYHQAANKIAKSLGMDHTVFAGDASGFLPATVSTPHDLVLLGQAALSNPVIRQIVDKRSAVLPIAGAVYNYNSLLGNSNFIGIKTGNSNQAGGCFLFAATYQPSNNKQITVIGAVMDAPNLSTAINDATPLFDSFTQNITQRQVLIAGQVIAQYDVPWEGHVGASVQNSTSLWGWKGAPVHITVSTLPHLPIPAAVGTKIGSVTIKSNIDSKSVPLFLNRAVSSPSLAWRLTHK